MSVSLDLANAPLVSQTGLWTWDVTRDLVFSDPVLSRVFGISEEQGREGQPLGSMLEAVHPDDRTLVSDNITKCLSGTPFHQRYRVLSRRFGERTVVAIGRTFYGADRKPTHFPGYIIDVSVPLVSDAELLSIHLAACRDVAQRVDSSAVTYLFESLEQEVSRLKRASGSPLA